MTTMTDNLDELKQKWQQMSARVEQLEETNLRLTERLAHSKVTTLQEKLAARIRRWGYIGFLLPFLAPVLSLDLGLPWWYSCLYGFYGLLAAANSFWLSHYIMEERLTDLPVSKAIERASRIKMRQQRCLIVGYISVVVLLGVGAFLLPESDMYEGVLVGGAVGAVVGFSIGTPRAVANIRMAKKMIESLK